MEHKQSRLIVGSALGLAALLAAVDHTRHKLPEPVPQVEQQMLDDEAPCGLTQDDEDSPCGLDVTSDLNESDETEAPCGLSVSDDSESPCGL